MKTSNKGFDYCYNAQAVVDATHQIIVAAEVTSAANDKQQAVPLAKSILENLSVAGIALPQDDAGQPVPIPNTADTGYYSESNVEEVSQLGFNPYYATGRQKHNAPREAPEEPSAGKTPPAAKPTPKAAMAAKLKTDSGRKLYAARKHIVKPVFGQIKHVRDFRQFLRRGLECVSAEWQLLCLTHNLLKIWRHQMLPV
jgi:hypothetical protein